MSWLQTQGGCGLCSSKPCTLASAHSRGGWGGWFNARSGLRTAGRLTTSSRSSEQVFPPGAGHRLPPRATQLRTFCVGFIFLGTGPLVVIRFSKGLGPPAGSINRQSLPLLRSLPPWQTSFSLPGTAPRSPVPGRPAELHPRGSRSTLSVTLPTKVSPRVLWGSGPGRALLCPLYLAGCVGRSWHHCQSCVCWDEAPGRAASGCGHSCPGPFPLWMDLLCCP